MTARHIVEGAAASLMVTISTAHLTAGDDTLLRRLTENHVENDGGRIDHHAWCEAALGAGAGYAVPMEGGWLVRVQEDSAEDEDQMVRDAGFSEAFASLIVFWRERNVGWVRLDRDAAVVVLLPVFGW